MKKIPREHIIKMNNKTVRELRTISKDKGFRGYYKLKKDGLAELKKDGLAALLLRQSAEEMLTPPARAGGRKEGNCNPSKDNLKPSRNG